LTCLGQAMDELAGLLPPGLPRSGRLRPGALEKPARGRPGRAAVHRPTTGKHRILRPIPHRGRPRPATPDSATSPAASSTCPLNRRTRLPRRAARLGRHRTQDRNRASLPGRLHLVLRRSPVRLRSPATSTDQKPRPNSPMSTVDSVASHRTINARFTGYQPRPPAGVVGHVGSETPARVGRWRHGRGVALPASARRPRARCSLHVRSEMRTANVVVAGHRVTWTWASSVSALSVARCRASETDGFFGGPDVGDPEADARFGLGFGDVPVRSARGARAPVSGQCCCSRRGDRA